MFRRKRSDKDKAIPIRQLAEYAADPHEYLKTQGRVRNRKAVIAGNRGETALGRTFPTGKVLLMLMLGGVVAWKTFYG